MNLRPVALHPHGGLLTWLLLGAIVFPGIAQKWIQDESANIESSLAAGVGRRKSVGCRKPVGCSLKLDRTAHPSFSWGRSCLFHFLSLPSLHFFQPMGYPGIPLGYHLHGWRYIHRARNHRARSHKEPPDSRDVGWATDHPAAD